MRPVGRKVWAIADGYIPAASISPDPGAAAHDVRLISHETACILNAGDRDARIEIMLYFSDRDPAGPYVVTVPGLRTLHLRFNDLSDPESIPRETDYAAIIRSDVPIVVQHTRLDSRDPNIALLSTVAYAQD